MGATVAIVAAVSVIGHYLFLRADLTAERRYTLSRHTKEMLKKIDEPVLFRVYLEGEFPSDFKRLQSETKEMLNQFRAYNSNIDYEFYNPNNFENREEQQMFYQKLAQKGIQPTQIQVKSDNGVTQQILIPAADVYYKGRETTVQLLQSQKYVSDADLLNNSIQNLEYNLSSAIRALSRGEKRSIGFLQGHGELTGGVLYDFQRSLAVVGESGTAKKIKIPVEGVSVHLKTGTISGVKALAGYVDAANGDRLAFAIISNGHTCRSSVVTEKLTKILQKIASLY
jgi:ABC-2 type transport system permease protein